MDIIITNARLANYKDKVTIKIKDGLIVAIEDINHVNNNDANGDSIEDKAANHAINSNAHTVYDAKSNFVCAGFYESHIHLDKACILDRCNIETGDLDEAVSETGKAKAEFSEGDVYGCI